MVRPHKFRRIGFDPNIIYFKPMGVPLHSLEEVILSADELESLRLKDFEGRDQIQSAKQMEISQPTFNRILNAARRKVADALINGKAIRIERIRQI